MLFAGTRDKYPLRERYVFRVIPRLPYLPGRRLKQAARLVFVARSYVKEIVKCIGRFPLSEVLFGMRHAFAADRVFLYGRQGILSGDYLTDLQRQFTRFINSKPARELLEDKLLFERVVGYLACVPTNYLYCDDRRPVVVSDEWDAITRCRDPEITHRLVLKRARGGGGIRIKFIEMRQGTVRLGDKTMSLTDFYGFFARRDENLLCKFIEQSDFCHKIYPHTTNTLRIICMRESNGEPFIGRAVLRLGTQKSKGVDNFGQGGLAASVDLETGTLGRAVEHYTKAPRPPSIYPCHPDTNTPIAGEALPGWEGARDVVLRLMHQLPFLNYVGWDVIMTNSGPVILEGNNYSGVRLAQIDQGLLSDNRVRAFYQRFGIVPGDGVEITCPAAISRLNSDVI
jgi:Sugar-transfer associated ATP-grasp